MTTMTTQFLTLTLDGITAGDYMTWVRDPEPPALGQTLVDIRVATDPLGDTIEAALAWDGPAPAPLAAAPAAGLPLTPEVVSVRPRRGDVACGAEGRRQRLPGPAQRRPMTTA
jgi:hypothetical protein